MQAERDTIGAQATRNIQTISELEQKALDRRSGPEKFSDLIVYEGGRTATIVMHAVWFGAWILWNSNVIPGTRKFDPPPFMALTTIVSLEAIFLSLFILVSQNRATRRADERAHLDLQINLLAEHETTKMLRLIQALCAHHGLPEAQDPEVKQLIRETEPATIAEELEQRLPG